MARPQRTNESRLFADRYAIVDSIGSGAPPTCFACATSTAGVVRAAKVLKTENSANPKSVARFEDEFRILRTLHHPHLPEVYDYGWTDDGGRFLMMELVDEVPLDEYFRRAPRTSGRFSTSSAKCFLRPHPQSAPSGHQAVQHPRHADDRVRWRTAARQADRLRPHPQARRCRGRRVVGHPRTSRPKWCAERRHSRARWTTQPGGDVVRAADGAPPFVGTDREVLRAHVEREPVIDDEKFEWAELYPHVRALLTKNPQSRLVAFEELRRAVTSRLTGGIEKLDQAYKLARAESTPIRQDAWDDAKQWLATPSRCRPPAILRRNSPSRLSVAPAPCAVAWWTRCAPSRPFAVVMSFVSAKERRPAGGIPPTEGKGK